MTNSRPVLVSILVLVLLSLVIEHASATREEFPDDEALHRTGPGTPNQPVLLAQKRILKSEIVAGDKVEVEIELINITPVSAVDVVVEDEEWESPISVQDGATRHTLPLIQGYSRAVVKYTLIIPDTEGEFSGAPAKITYRRGHDSLNSSAGGDLDLDAEHLKEAGSSGDSAAPYVSYSTQIYEDAELPYDRMNPDGTVRPQSRSGSSNSGSAAARSSGFVPPSAGKMRVLSQQAFNQRHSHHAREGLLFSILLLVPIGLPYYYYYKRRNELEQALLKMKKVK